MATVNDNLVLAELNKKIKELNSDAGKNLSGQMASSLDEVADEMITVLRNAIRTSGLSSHAIDVLLNDLDMDYSTSIISNGKASVMIYFTGDLTRPSLDQDVYGDINDIVELLNYGVDHQMKAVHGLWHGKDYWSKTVYPGAYFLEQAVVDFNANYSSEYRVESISIIR